MIFGEVSENECKEPILHENAYSNSIRITEFFSRNYYNTNKTDIQIKITNKLIKNSLDININRNNLHKFKIHHIYYILRITQIIQNGHNLENAYFAL